MITWEIIELQNAQLPVQCNCSMETGYLSATLFKDGMGEIVKYYNILPQNNIISDLHLLWVNHNIIHGKHYTEKWV